MNFASINWLAVFVSVIASVLIGSIWYSPSGLYKPWLTTLGKTWENRSRGPVVSLYVFTIIAALVEAVALALMLNTMRARGLGPGAAAGFMLWLGFVAPTNLVNKLFSGQGWTGWLIEAGEHLVYLLVAGAILGAWH